MPVVNEEQFEAIADRAANKALEGLFLHIGVDTQDPLAMQKDFAHLRAWRESSDLIKSRTIATAVGIIITGICAAIYAALTHRF